MNGHVRMNHSEPRGEFPGRYTSVMPLREVFWASGAVLPGGFGTTAGGTVGRVLAGRGARGVGRRRPGDEVAAQGQMEVHPLDQAFRLDPQQGGLRRIEPELLLLHREKVARSHPVLHPAQLHASRVLGDDLLQQPFAFAQTGFGAERVFDLAERPQDDAPVIRHRFLLLRRAQFDLGFEGAAAKERREQVQPNPRTGLLKSSWSWRKSLLMAPNEAVRLMLGRRAASASFVR